MKLYNKLIALALFSTALVHAQFNKKEAIKATQDFIKEQNIPGLFCYGIS